MGMGEGERVGGELEGRELGGGLNGSEGEKDLGWE